MLNMRVCQYRMPTNIDTFMFFTKSYLNQKMHKVQISIMHKANFQQTFYKTVTMRVCIAMECVRANRK